MHLTLVISSLAPGGAERVMSTMANYWVEKGWDITLVTLCDGTGFFYPLDQRVKRIALNAAGQSMSVLKAVCNNTRRIVKLRTAIRSSAPDAVISFLDHINVLVLLATRGLGVPVVVSERIDPSWHDIGKVWESLRNLAYPWADAVVVQTRGALTWASSRISAERSVVIPNPVCLAPSWLGQECGSFSMPFLLAMGRLEEQKGFDLLLRAVARVLPDFPIWSMVILGEGPQRRELEELARELGLDGRVQFPGRHANPIAVMRQAELFVLSSRFEGFPNALCEAMAAGLPAVSFDCPSGPGAIIRHGVDGILVRPGDVSGLAAAMRELMAHPERRKELAARAVDIVERFGLKKVMSMWEQLLARLGKSGTR